jgi:hypothetical protein
MMVMSKKVIVDSCIAKMQILMDFASVANKNSFEEIENEIDVLKK